MNSRISRIQQNPIYGSSLRILCVQGSLNEAYKSTGGLTDVQSPSGSCPVETCAQVLQRCAAKKSLTEGEQIHAYAVKSSFGDDSEFLNTKLVFMYGKCGSILNAEKVFDKMPHRSIFTWNAMIGAYITNNDPLGSLQLYTLMCSSDIPPDSCTFPLVLKACGLVKDRLLGAQFHNLAIKYGYTSVTFVVNALVTMYAKCNDLVGARKLFDSMIIKNDIVSWNSIISGYSTGGKSLEALELFRVLQEIGLEMNTYTIVSALQACEDSSYRKIGTQIHAVIVKSIHELDVYVGNALIAMYVRFGEMRQASNIFLNLKERDRVSWNSFLSGFVQNGLYMEALQLFRDMQDSGQKPDQVSILNVISASGRAGNLLHGMEAHAYAMRRGFDPNPLVGNTIIDMYSKCGSVKYMGHAFEVLPVKDKISWTTIIAGHSQNGCHVTALNVFRQVMLDGMEVDEMMIGSILLSCNGLKSTHYVKEVHGFILRRGVSDLVLQNTLVDAYGDCGDVGYASQTFQSIQNKDVISWTSLMSSYVRNGFASEAFDVFFAMREAGVDIDCIALVSAVSASAALSVMTKGKELHGYLVRQGFVLEGSIASSLIDMYARCGNLDSSTTLFSSIVGKDIILWTTMINAYAMHGHAKAAIELFNVMEEESTVPDEITFLSILYACSHSMLVDEGKQFLEIMQQKYHLEPWPQHYASVVDLLGRANRLDEAYQFIGSLPIKPTAEIWCALLGACRVHSNKILGEIAADKLLDLVPENPGNYVLMSNHYAAGGRWKDVEDLRMKMKASGLNKNPGCSWIEVENKIHSFIARDKSHPESDKIYQKLSDITEKLAREGRYIPETKFVLHNVEEEEKVKLLHGHSERLAIAYGLLKTREGTPIRVAKNLRVCGDCHNFCKLVSKQFGRILIVRDANRFHHFEGGFCSCGDRW